MPLHLARQAGIVGISEGKLFRALFDNSMEAMVISSPDGQIYRANAEACRLLGMTEREICEAGRRGVVDESQPKFDMALQERRRTGRWRGELFYRRKDGTLFPGETSSAIFRDERDQERNIVVFRDVSEQKRQEEQQGRLAAIVEGSDDAIIGKALDETVTSWNGAAEQMYGYKEQEIVGRSIDLIVPEEQKQEQRDLAEKLRHGERVSHFETKRRTKDGRIVDVSLTMSPIRNRSGEIVGVSTIARDIGERKRAEEERERLIQELRAALAEVKTLSGLLPICAHCKKIRDDKGYWNQIETFIRERSGAKFTHSICPECASQHYPELYKDLQARDGAKR